VYSEPRDTSSLTLVVAGTTIRYRPDEGWDMAHDAHMELPRPGRLVLSVLVSMAESLGLPVAGYIAGMALSGQNAAMLVATAVVWLTAAVRKAVTRKVPSMLIISAAVLTVQTALVVGTGNQLFFLLQFPLANLALCVLFARTAPTKKPLAARLAAEVISLRQPAAGHAGLDAFFRDATWLWAGVFAALTVGMAVLMVSEPARLFLLLTTAVTIGGVVVGIGLSAVWFLRAVRRFGLRVRLAPAHS
jgi:intracellular septation protein A